MTIKDAKEMYKNEYADIEVYEPLSTGRFYPKSFHTDNCRSTDNYNEDTEVKLVELMDEDDYNDTLLANTDIHVDFEDLYGNKNAKVLCVMIDKKTGDEN